MVGIFYSDLSELFFSSKLNTFLVIRQNLFLNFIIVVEHFSCPSTSFSQLFARIFTNSCWQNRCNWARQQINLVAHTFANAPLGQRTGICDDHSNMMPLFSLSLFITNLAVRLGLLSFTEIIFFGYGLFRAAWPFRPCRYRESPCSVRIITSSYFV